MPITIRRGWAADTEKFLRLLHEVKDGMDHPYNCYSLRNVLKTASAISS